MSAVYDDGLDDGDDDVCRYHRSFRCAAVNERMKGWKRSPGRCPALATCCNQTSVNLSSVNIKIIEFRKWFSFGPDQQLVVVNLIINQPIYKVFRLKNLNS